MTNKSTRARAGRARSATESGRGDGLGAMASNRQASDRLLDMEEPLQRLMRASTAMAALANAETGSAPSRTAALAFLSEAISAEAGRLHSLYHGKDAP